MHVGNAQEPCTVLALANGVDQGKPMSPTYWDGCTHVAPARGPSSSQFKYGEQSSVARCVMWPEVPVSELVVVTAFKPESVDFCSSCMQGVVKRLAG
jgi:hypothetical protein